MKYSIFGYFSKKERKFEHNLEAFNRTQGFKINDPFWFEKNFAFPIISIFFLSAFMYSIYILIKLSA